MINNDIIVEALSNLDVDTSSLSEEVVDTVAVSFYVDRLAMCLNDECFNAANAYLEKMQNNSDINTSTKLEILHEYQKLTLREEP